MRPSQMQHLIYLSLLTAILAPCNGALAYTGGVGTPADPFILTTPGDLRDLALNPADWCLCFELVADVNMRGVEFARIGTAQAPFCGVFNGGNHRITNLFVYDDGAVSGGVGLFGVVRAEGLVSGVTLEEPTVIGNSGEYVGALVGRLDSGTVSRCAVLGGRVFAEVSRDSRVGGLVGANVAGLVSQCYSTAMVEGTSYCGGLVGENLDYGVIMDCYATGRVIMRPLCLIDQGYRVGGLIGVSRGGVSTCYAACPVDLLLPSDATCAGCNGGVMGAVIPGSVPFSSVFANFASAALSDKAVGCGTMPSVGAQTVSSEALTHKETFKYWDLDAVWYMPVGAMPRLRWQNRDPIAVPGADQIVTIASGQATATVVLDGSGSYDPDGDPLTYRWTLANATYSEAQPSLVLAQGEYAATLVVNDGAVDSAPQTVRILVNRDTNPEPQPEPEPEPEPEPTVSEPPVAVAGADLVLFDDGTGHQAVTLDGSGSYDPEGSALTYLWAWSVGGIDRTATGSRLTIDLPVGEHTVSLVVNDGTQDSTADTVKVSIVESLKVSGVCSPGVIGRQSTIAIDDIRFYLSLPRAVKEARASNVDPKVPIQVSTLGGTTVTATQQRDCYNNLTIVASVPRRSLLDAVGVNGKVSLRVLARLNTGRPVESTVSAEIVPGPGPSYLEVLFERIQLLMRYGG